MTERYQTQLENQTDSRVTEASQRAALSAATSRQERKLENEYFLNELRKADLDSEVVDWLEDEYPSWFSGARAVGNRPSSWDLEATLMMDSRAERAYAARNPGRLLLEDDHLLAIAQGRREPNEDGEPAPLKPMNSDQRQKMRGASEVAADLMTLSKNAAGLEATTTATTEARIRRDSKEESSASRIGRGIFG